MHSSSAHNNTRAPATTATAAVAVVSTSVTSEYANALAEAITILCEVMTASSTAKEFKRKNRYTHHHPHNTQHITYPLINHDRSPTL